MRKIYALLLALSFILVPFVRDTHTFYPDTMIIVELDYTNDTVTCADVAGNILEFYGCEDYSEGDLVRMLMYDNGTPETIYDDEIVIVWYAGTLGQFEDAYVEYWHTR